jgi:subtilase family serine protease
MKMGFNTSGNNQSSGRTTPAVLVGRLRNTVASTTRKFKYCNTHSSELMTTFNCVFNDLYQPLNETFDPYHILTGEIPLELIETGENDESGDSIMPLTKALLRGPFTPAQIRKAYSVPTLMPLAGIRRPIVTVITAFNNPYLVNDVRTFGRVFGLPACDLQVVNFSRSFNTTWAIETSLNVQWVYAMNPYARIRVIQAASSSWQHIFNAINYANNKNNFSPKIDTDLVTMSFGSPDNGNMTFFNNIFNNSNTIYLAASGNSNNVSAPSSCTNVIAVGGTTLNLNSNFTRAIEITWSNAGSGFSRSFTKPLYQPSVQPNNQRTTPDVCCVADPNTGCYVILNGRAYSVGGTSLASPLYAGMLSLVIQNRLNNRKTTFTSIQNQINTIQPLLYSNQTCFFDVRQGRTGVNVAGPGFDVASGLGVLNCSQLINNLS